MSIVITLRVPLKVIHGAAAQTKNWIYTISNLFFWKYDPARIGIYNGMGK